MAHSFDIVAYMYQADLYCAGCITEVLPTGPGEKYDGWSLADGVSMSTEADLDEIAAAFGIDRKAEETFDSGEFPKVVFRDQLEGDEYCGKCQTPLDEE